MVVYVLNTTNVFCLWDQTSKQQPLSAMLTPDHFQQPVQMLNAIQQGLSSMQPPYSIGGGGGSLPHMQNFKSPSGTKLDIGHKKRRSSSTSAPSLDDQGLCSGSSI